MPHVRERYGLRKAGRKNSAPDLADDSVFSGHEERDVPGRNGRLAEQLRMFYDEAMSSEGRDASFKADTGHS